MDPLTHGLFGALTARVGLRQRIGRDATWMLAGAAMSPDLDVLARPLIRLAGGAVNQWTGLVTHRGPTHSLLVLPVIALLIALPWWLTRGWALRRRQRDPQRLALPPAPFWLLYLSAALAVGTHILLDWCTSYGTQVFWPLSNARYAADMVAVVDVFFLGLLTVGVAGGIALRQRRRLSRAVAWASLLLALAYLGTGRFLHDGAVERARKLVARTDPAAVVRADAYPALGSLLLWRAVVETEQAWHVVRVHYLANADQPLRHEHAAKCDADGWVARATALGEAEIFAWFAMSRVRTAYSRTDGGHVIELHDMRYGLLPSTTESLWFLRVFMDDDGAVRDVAYMRGYLRHDRWAAFGQTWAEIVKP